jgi:hypothetical protein
MEAIIAGLIGFFILLKINGFWISRGCLKELNEK